MIDQELFIASWTAWERHSGDRTRAARFEANCQQLAVELGIGANNLRRELCRIRRAPATKAQAFASVIDGVLRGEAGAVTVPAEVAEPIGPMVHPEVTTVPAHVGDRSEELS